MTDSGDSPEHVCAGGDSDDSPAQVFEVRTRGEGVREGIDPGGVGEIFTNFRPGFPLNASVPIDVTVEGMVTSVSLLSAKAPLPIEVVSGGMRIAVNPLIGELGGGNGGYCGGNLQGFADDAAPAVVVFDKGDFGAVRVGGYFGAYPSGNHFAAVVGEDGAMRERCRRWSY